MCCGKVLCCRSQMDGRTCKNPICSRHADMALSRKLLRTRCLPDRLALAAKPGFPLAVYFPLDICCACLFLPIARIDLGALTFRVALAISNSFMSNGGSITPLHVTLGNFASALQPQHLNVIATRALAEWRPEGHSGAGR